MTYHHKIAHLRESDPVLRAVIDRVNKGGNKIVHTWHEKRRPNHFRALVIAIINQQLSGKAADTIQKRFEALFIDARQKQGAGKVAGRTVRLNKAFPTPEEVLKMPTVKLRKVGLSGMKVSFMKDLAKKVLDGTVDFKKMAKWSDEEVIEHLVEVKGIGQWTAEMFLMFSLQRDDVFSYGDLGLRNAMQRIYKLKNHPSPKQAEKITEKWKPYRTLASRYLWASLENR
jgi:DNA-3-methyladenine glycosylase II